MDRTAEENQEGRLGRLAVDRGVLTPDQLRDAVAIRQQLRELGVDPKEVAQICIEKGYLTREQVAELEDHLKRRDEWPRLPGYEILDRIGRGGMGAVYKARQVSLDRTVAIKVLAPRFEEDETYIRRFVSEARSVARLNHRNVIAGIDVGEAGGRHYFVMEYVDGETASRRQERSGPLPEAEIVSIGLQMSHALGHAAEHGLVHRDIKPQNIMLTEKGVAKLCDLGLAKQREKAAEAPSGGRSLGTPYYISPEQAKGPEYADIRSDIYSLGATLFHLATGEPPFDGPSALVIMTKQMTEPPPSIRRKNPRISVELERIIHKMMAKKMEDRHQSPEALAEDLSRLEKRGGRGGSPARGRRRLGRRRSGGGGNRPGLVVATGVILLAAVGVIILASGSLGGGGGIDPAKDAEAHRALTTVADWIQANPDAAPAVQIRRLTYIIDNYQGTDAAEKARRRIEAIRSGR